MSAREELAKRLLDLANSKGGPLQYAISSRQLLREAAAALGESGGATSPKQVEFERDLASAVNRQSRENASNTPDFILATFMASCLTAFENASRHREQWYGQSLGIGAALPSPAPEEQTNDEELLNVVADTLPNSGLVGDLRRHPDRFLLAKAFRAALGKT